MECNLSSGNMMGGNSGFDLQGSTRANLQHYQSHFPKDICLGKCASDEDEPEGKKGGIPQWQRVKWTDEMVRLLITAVSYIGEEEEYGGARKCSKKGKWKSVSKVMAERAHFVSPQQCEDKFNDLNKRYKRLNEILGRGTSCEVVENPALLDVLDHVSHKGKEEVRKILSSKHLHYEEMCSYHNGNRLHLPPDPELQRSLRFALKNRDDDNNKHLQDEDDEEADHEDEYEDNHSGGGFSKRIKQCQGHEAVNLASNRTLISQPHTDGNKADILQKQWMDHRSLQLQEQKLHIQAQMLELEKERFNWQRFSRKKDIELEVMRTENERIKLENESLALELKRKEMLADNA
ncbi:uncharacterized protein LOC132041458 [Lycium ferocissimum]|uniref:uncharacterized protein LOC132041458 n=1 Tax=Lycium ferocissimum TaxID=112874 RepID=UPI0028155D05|nr:uncharacterized protein LOC132041458 [Lycium ferocissimum]